MTDSQVSALHEVDSGMLCSVGRSYIICYENGILFFLFSIFLPYTFMQLD